MFGLKPQKVKLRSEEKLGFVGCVQMSLAVTARFFAMNQLK